MKDNFSDDSEINDKIKNNKVFPIGGIPKFRSNNDGNKKNMYGNEVDIKTNVENVGDDSETYDDESETETEEASMDDEKSDLNEKIDTGKGRREIEEWMKKEKFYENEVLEQIVEANVNDMNELLMLDEAKMQNIMGQARNELAKKLHAFEEKWKEAKSQTNHK